MMQYLYKNNDAMCFEVKWIADGGKMLDCWVRAHHLKILKVHARPIRLRIPGIVPSALKLVLF